MTATGMTLPAGVVEGDFLLMYVFFDMGASTSGSITNPTGWATFLDLPHTANGDMWRVLYKVVGAGEGALASPTFNGATTGTSGGVGLCRVVAYSGVDTSALPSSALAGSSGGNGFTNQQNMGAIAGFTPTSPDVRVCVFAGKKDDWTSVATLTGDGLTWTEDFESVTTNASDAGMVLDSAPIVGAPVAITNKTFTVTGGATANGLGRMFALKPAAVTTTTHELGGVIAGSGSVSGALSVDEALGGAVAGAGTVAGDLATDRALEGAVEGQGALAGDLAVTSDLEGSVAGAGTLAGDLTVVPPGPVTHELGGAVEGAGVVAGDLSVDQALEGTVAGAGGLSGDLSVVVPVEPTPVLVVESPRFDPGCVVDVVLITPANAQPWAHEHREERPGLPSRIVSERPRQAPVASGVADAFGVARFEGLPDGRYWIVGERGGVVRRVARWVP